MEAVSLQRRKRNADKEERENKRWIRRKGRKNRKTERQRGRDRTGWESFP